jgi:hypothetical protein
MTIVLARTDEIVEAQVQRVLQLMEAVRISANQGVDRYAGRFGGLDVLEAVFVGARLEADLIPLQTIQARQAVRLDHLHCEADMRRCVDVGN